MDTENRAFRLERCSNYARKTPRQTIQALRREIGSRGRDPSQGAVRPAKRAVPRPRKAGGGIWGRRRGRVSRKRQPRREQGLRDAEAQEGERGAPQGGRDTEKKGGGTPSCIILPITHIYVKQFVGKVTIQRRFFTDITAGNTFQAFVCCTTCNLF